MKPALAAKGWHPRIAVVSGDDVLPQLHDPARPATALAHLFTGQPVPIKKGVDAATAEARLEAAQGSVRAALG